MRLRNPGGIDQALPILAQLSAELGNTMTGGRGIGAARDAWLSWYQRADPQLRNLFTDSELASDLHRTQLEVQHMGEDALPYIHLSHVLDVWKERFEEIAAQLKALQGFVLSPGAVVIPDTSAFIEGDGLMDADWSRVANIPEGDLVRVVIPVLVIEELDENKRHRSNRVMERARETLNALWHLPVTAGGQRVVRAGITVEVLLDDPWHRRRPVNDVEIVDRAAYVRELTGSRITVAACDYAMLFRAQEVGLTAVHLPPRRSTAVLEGSP
jgi:PIN domain